MKNILAVVIMTLCNCGVVFAGYTILQPPKIEEYVIVNGAYGLESRSNPATVILPPGFVRTICPPKNRYSADPTDRIMVIEDAAGTAESIDVLNACPDLRGGVVDQVKDLRRQALNKAAIDAGILAVYDENYAASVAHLAGQGGTIMKNGQTATNYLTGFGMMLGMNPTQFATYIISENRRVGPTAYQVEQEYLRLAYTAIPSETNVATLLAYADGYRRFCGL